MTMELNSRWSTAKFDRKAGFVCEKAQEDFCLFDLVPHSKSCYDFYLNPFAASENWDANKDTCKNSGMKMIIEENKGEVLQ